MGWGGGLAVKKQPYHCFKQKQSCNKQPVVFLIENGNGFLYGPFSQREMPCVAEEAAVPFSFPSRIY